MILLPVRYTIRSFDSDLDIRFENGLSVLEISLEMRGWGLMGLMSSLDSGGWWER